MRKGQLNRERHALPKVDANADSPWPCRVERERGEAEGTSHRADGHKRLVWPPRRSERAKIEVQPAAKVIRKLRLRLRRLSWRANFLTP